MFLNISMYALWGRGMPIPKYIDTFKYIYIQIKTINQ